MVDDVTTVDDVILDEEDGDYFLQNTVIPNPDTNPSRAIPHNHQIAFFNLLCSYDTDNGTILKNCCTNSAISSKSLSGSKSTFLKSEKKKFNNKDPATMQRLYCRNHHRAARDALETPTSQCTVSSDELKNKFFAPSTMATTNLYTISTSPPLNLLMSLYLFLWRSKPSFQRARILFLDSTGSSPIT